MTDSPMTGQPLLLPGASEPFGARSAARQHLGFDDSVYQRLLRERIIFLGSVVEDNIANALSAQMLLLAAEDPEQRHLPVHQLARWLGLCGHGALRHDAVRPLRRRDGRHGPCRVHGSVLALCG